MSTSTDEDVNTCYQKYKCVVKRWEREFLRDRGRVPSRYDIREAPYPVKAAYKKYVALKSHILETSLMDLPLDDDDSIFGDGFDITGSQELTFDSFNLEVEDTPFSHGGPSIPSTEEIKLLLSHSMKVLPDANDNKDDSQKSLICDKVWGKHLNNKKKEVKSPKDTPPAKNNLSAKLFKSFSFNLRNPRKTLPPPKTQSLTESQTENNYSTTENNEIVIESKYKVVDISVNQNAVSCTSVNPIQQVLVKNMSVTRNINSGWLERCANPLLENDSVSDLPSNLKSQSDIQDTNKEMNKPSTSYGLKNINVSMDVSKYDESNLSDFVENSESEPETRLTIYKKIKPVVKKCKLDATATAKIKESRRLSIIKENPPEKESPEVKTTRKRVAKKSMSNTNKTKSAKNTRVKPVEKPKNIKLKSGRKVVKKTENNLTSESECDEQIINIPKTRRRSQKSVDVAKFEFSDENCENEYTNHLIDEKVSYPRFPINSSILKESNLVDSLTAALVIPKDEKSKSRNVGTSAEDKLRKKIKDGTLNDNFVSINLEKKVYARGKKGRNFSTYKKQQWKNKKKMLHDAPEFPEGGIIKCFKCGQPGHMSRYCKAGKGGSLLPLEDTHNRSPYMSIREAEELKNKSSSSKVMETVAYECIETNNSQDQNLDIILTSKGIHKIPDSFIKLLASTPVTVNYSQTSIDPLYSLSPDNSVMPTPNEVKDALHLFGHSDFRSGQEMAIMRILSGLSTLVTLSTGSGKSLCYQLPAYLYAKHNKCVTLVVSPLVSLMEDQVINMPGFLQAACLHTNQSPTQRDKIMQLITSGQIHVLLVSPEAIVAGEKSTGFGAVLRQLPPIAFTCIDEVHCVSQWSHNFRPSYLMICRVLREKLGVKCILGLTATATTPTIAEIVQHLNIPDGIQSVITNKPLPDNLILTVSRDLQRDPALLQLLKCERFSECNSIIVYCIRRDECERIASLLRSAMQHCRPVYNEQIKESKKRKRFSFVVEAYHAGMSAAKRKKVQQAFMAGELRIVVATVAFGMGIDKSDIRGVIHYNMPTSFESYVQEVGRAGRDGLPAQCHLFIDNEYKDKDELLRHIHANSIERHSIRKLLQKVFLPCGCDKLLQNTVNKCEGHEVAFSVDQTVTELDIPSENISTLLCYLELHPKKYAKVLSRVYIMCKISSYGGVSAITKAAETCPPLAMALALERKKGNDLSSTTTFEFCVIEVAAAIGWESGVVKYHLKNLEWEKHNGSSKKSLLRIEFNTLGLRVKAPGDLTSVELDAALDSLYDRTQLQEKASLFQLHEVFKAMSSVSYPTIYECSEFKDADAYTTSSDKLKDMIRNYFARKTPCNYDIEIEERTVNKQQVIGDVRGLLSTYCDCTFTGRAVARILQGISSPNFPAIVWGRCRFWRSHLSADFYKLVEIAKEQIISMR